MKTVFSICILLCAIVVAHSQNLKNNRFIENKGQIIDQNGNLNNDVLYLLNTKGLNVQLRKNGFSYDVYEYDTKTKNNNLSIPKWRYDTINKENSAKHLKFHRVDIDFINSNSNIVIEETNESNSYINYYIGNSNEEITHVKTFKKIIYKNVYDHIDVEFFIPNDIAKPFEYNFIIHPKGNISDIMIDISGANTVCYANNLEIKLTHGNLQETIPASWITKNHKNIPVDVNFIQIDENIFGFSYDPSKNTNNSVLTIDPTPVREWATYFGGENRESWIMGDSYSDENGDTVIGGRTKSMTNIATSGSFQSTFDTSLDTNGFIAKFDASGALIWTTYYGYFLKGVTIDTAGNVLAVGETTELANIATPGAHQNAVYPGISRDGFLVKFNSNGTRIWGTYYGGESFEDLNTVITDDTQNVYIAGATASNENISTPGSFKEDGNTQVNTNWDAFLVKFDQNGTRQWATYYGGDGHDHINELDIDVDGNILFVGTTSSSNGISTPGVYQETQNFNPSSGQHAEEAFIGKFTPNGERIWGTYFGGFDYDFGDGIATDSQNNILISGSTVNSSLISTTGAHQEVYGGDWDAFLAKFSPTGTILWSTYYGGSEDESWSTTTVDVDANDHIFLYGNTLSDNNIATAGSFQETRVLRDLFLTKFTPEGERVWGTYYGGNTFSASSSLSINVLTTGDIYLYGFTTSTSGFTTSGAYQEVNGGQEDCFLIKFRDCESSINANVSNTVCENDTIVFNASGGISYSWSGPNGFSSNDPNLIINNANATHEGTYSVFIESSNGCDFTQTYDVSIHTIPTVNSINDITACEDSFGSNISGSFDTSTIESDIIGNQTGLTIEYYNQNGDLLPSPLPNPFTNTIAGEEIITAQVYNTNAACYAEVTFSFIVESLPEATQIDDIHVCDDNTDGIGSFDLSNLENQLIGTQANTTVTYVNSNNEAITPISNYQNIVPNQDYIIARIINTLNQCYTDITINLIVDPIPTAFELDDLLGCDDNGDGISEYFDTSEVETIVIGNQTNVSVSYFDASGNALANPLPNPFTNTTPFNQNITVRVTNTMTDCYDETILTLNTSAQPSINQPNDLYACDEGNGISHFDTSSVENELIGTQTGLVVSYFDQEGNTLPSPLPVSFQNTTPYAQTITVRVEDAASTICYSETSFELIVNNLPEINLEESYTICDLEPFLPLSIHSGFDTYSWVSEDGTVISNTHTANIVDAGNYTVTVSQITNGLRCENSFTFQLTRSVLPTIQTVNFDQLGNNYIEIIATGDGDFEYSINGINYQDSNLFENISGGTYTVYVRDKNGCGEDSDEVTLIDYPNFFTPNNDTYNDSWNIYGIEKYPKASIIIFDRYGKMIKELLRGESWDGNYKGRKMPSSEYWFTAVLNTDIKFRGHFSLVRK